MAHSQCCGPTASIQYQNILLSTEPPLPAHLPPAWLPSGSFLSVDLSVLDTACKCDLCVWLPYAPRCPTAHSRCSPTSFGFMTGWCPTGWTCHSLLTRSPMGEHLGGLRLLAVANGASVNARGRYPLEYLFSVLRDVHRGHPLFLRTWRPSLEERKEHQITGPLRGIPAWL